jgi:hypothetical protein
MDEDSGFDPERISKDLERLHEQRPSPSDRALLRGVRMGSLIDEISDLQHSLLLPQSPEREAEIVERLQVLSVQLRDLEDEERQEGSQPPPG